MSAPGARRRSALVALAGAAALLAGCGGSGTSSELQARLLSAADLPTGWSAVAAAKSSPEPSGACFAGLPKHSTGLTYETAAFVEGTALPNLGEAIATGPRVAQVWTHTAHTLAGCRSAAVAVRSRKVGVTIEALQLPPIGRNTSAFSWSFTLAGVHLDVVVVLLQVGRYGVYLSYSDLWPPEATTIAAFARAAAAKARSGSTARIPDSVSVASTPVQIAHTHLGAVAYRELGSGPPLLLIMGYGATMEEWDPRLVNALSQRRRVIVFDNAGTAMTQALRSPLTIDAMADQTSALIEALHIPHVDVLGWSMGSMIAQALAVRHRSLVRRLILCASYPGNGTTVRPSRADLNSFESSQEQSVMAALFPANQAAAVSTYLAAVSSYPPAQPVAADVLVAQRRAIDSWWAGTDAAGTQAARIAVPTLIADGTEDRLDPLANSHALAGVVRGAQLRLYPDAGHAFLFQDEASFLALVESFLS